MTDDTEFEPVFLPLFSMEEASRPTRWVIRNYLERSATGAIYGPSGALKSFVALEMAICVATGRPYRGNPVRRGSVLYLAAEGQRGLSKRILAWEKKNGALTEAEHGRLLRLNVHDEDGRVNLFGSFVPNLREAIEEHGNRIILVVIDTLAKSLGGKEETNEVFSEAIDNLEANLCRPLGVTVLLVHHSGKDPTKGMRGGSSIGGGVDFAFEIVAVKPNGYDHKPSDGIVDFDFERDSIRVQCRKQKDDRKIAPLWYRAERVKLFDEIDEDGEVIGELSSLVLVEADEVKPARAGGEEETSRILELFDGGMAPSNIAKAIGGRRADALKRVRKAIDGRN